MDTQPSAEYSQRIVSRVWLNLAGGARRAVAWAWSIRHVVMPAAILAFTVGFIITLLVAPIDWEAFAGWGYAGVFLVSLLTAATVVVPVPGMLATLVAGGIFHPVGIGIVSGAGATVGELSGYLLGWSSGRLVGDRWTRRIPASFKQKVTRLFDRHWFVVLFLLSVVPNPAFDVAGVIAGARNLPVWKFLIPVWLGRTLRMLLVAYLGAWMLGI